MIRDKTGHIKIFIPFDDVDPEKVAEVVDKSPHLKGLNSANCKGEKIWAMPHKKIPNLYYLRNTPVHDGYKWGDAVVCNGEHNDMPIVVRKIKPEQDGQ